ncbi:hypothetical protein GCM10027060_26620 [Nesterenkonia halophila]
MIPNITKGDRPGGLMVYLAGPGYRNEHEEPHIVAGSDDIMAWHMDDELNRESALQVAKTINDPHKQFGVDGPGGKHVWHCSLSLSVRDGVLADDRWQEVASDFMQAMDLDDPSSPKSPVRWAAIRHGFSESGNDHIHIIASLIRDDGTKASVHNDFQRAQSASRALEVKHGLEPLESKTAERSTRGYKHGELEAEAQRQARGAHWYRKEKLGEDLPEWDDLLGSERRQLIEEKLGEVRSNPQRLDLGRSVRAAATASRTEDEFVRRLRAQNLHVRPRYASGTQDVITGYSVAQRTPDGSKPVFYGGGQLGNDLKLSRLRRENGWSSTPEHATEAAAEWNAARRKQPITKTGREATEPNLEDWKNQNRAISDLVKKLRDVPVSDTETWVSVARETSGALSAWSKATEAVPGDLARAADALSLSAQTKKSTKPDPKFGGGALSDAAMMLTVASKGGKGTVAEAVMLRQFMKLSQAVYESAQAGRQAQLAQRMETDVRDRLTAVKDRLPTPQRKQSTSAVEDQQADSRGQSETRSATAEENDLTEEQRAVLDRMRASQAEDAEQAVKSPVSPKLDPQKHAPQHDRAAGRER